MSYSFDPILDEKEFDYPLLDDGIYDFEVIRSDRQMSKTGNPMARLNIHVWSKDNPLGGTMFDYLVFSKVGLNIKKIKHFCEATGLSEEYKSGQLREELRGLYGKVEIGVQEPQSKPNGGYYDRKNIVIDYVLTDQGATKFESASKGIAPNNLDDDIPFMRMRKYE